MHQQNCPPSHVAAAFGSGALPNSWPPFAPLPPLAPAHAVESSGQAWTWYTALATGIGHNVWRLRSNRPWPALPVVLDATPGNDLQGNVTDPRWPHTQTDSAVAGLVLPSGHRHRPGAPAPSLGRSRYNWTLFHNGGPRQWLLPRA